jgi:hypothetical protein
MLKATGWFAFMAFFSLANMCLAQSPMPPQFPTADAPDWIAFPSVSNTGNLTVSWDASTTAGVTYYLEMDTNSNFSAAQQIYSGSGVQFPCSGYANGAYYFRVRAWITGMMASPDTTGDHALYVDTSLPPPPAAPGVPTGLAVPALSGAVFSVSWTRMTGVVVYQVQQEYMANYPIGMPPPTGWGPTSSFSMIYDGSNNACLVAVDCDDNWFKFRVRAYVAYNGYPIHGAWSAWSSQVIVANAPPGMPSMLWAAGSTSGGKVTITVGGAYGGISYDFLEDLDTAFANPVQVFPTPSGSPGPPGGAVFDLTGKADGTTFYRARAVNSYGVSAWVTTAIGAVVTGNPPASAPSAPAALTVPAGSTSGTVTLRWTGVAGTTSYELQEDASAAFASPTGVGPFAAQTDLILGGRADGTYYYRVRAVNSIGASAWRDGANPCVVASSTAACSAAKNSATAMFRDIQPNETGALSLVLDLSADPAVDVRIERLTVCSTGSGDDGLGVSQLRLYRDANGDRAWTSGVDVLLQGPVVFSGDDGNAVFSGLGRTLTAGTTETWLVVADFAGTAQGGEDFTFTIAANPSGIDARLNASGLPVNTNGLPVSGTRFTVFGATTPGTLVASVSAGRPADGEERAGATTVVLAAFTLSAGHRETVLLTSLTVASSGTGDEALHVSAVRLAEDLDGDGVFTAGTDRVMGLPAGFGVDDGSAAFAPLSESVAANASMRILVLYDFSSNAGAGTSFRADLAGSSVVAHGAVTGQPTPVAGLPLAGRTVTISTTSRRSPACGNGGPTDGIGKYGAVAPLLFLAVALLALRKRKGRAKA